MRRHAPAYNGGPVGLDLWCVVVAARHRWLQQPGASTLVSGGLRGLEKECLRVTAEGRLSQQPHPAALGAALTHPYLTTDYSEALLEFVTPAVHSNAALTRTLTELHAFVHRALGSELLWPASMPCVLDPEQQIPIARYGRSNAGMMKTVYRRGLGYRYGRAMQAIAGAHFNFSLTGPFWQAYTEHEAAGDDPGQARSAAYMALVRNYRRYGWLVLHLCGASPALCRSFLPQGGPQLQEFDRSTWYAPYATSLRMSDLGYRNTTQARLLISTNSLAEYVDGLVSAVTTVDPGYQRLGVRVDGEYRQLNACVLQIENEYYSPIRPKPRKGSTERPTIALREDGVEYVEVRSLDLNPFEPVGADDQTLLFIETLLLWCLLEDSPPISATEQQIIDARDLIVAREGRRPDLAIPVADGGLQPLRELGLTILDRISEAAGLLDDGDGEYSAAVRAQREALLVPDRLPSARVLEAMRRERRGFFAYMLEIARSHREYFASAPVDGERERELCRLAAESLAAAQALERAEEAPFDQFLEAYFARV